MRTLIIPDIHQRIAPLGNILDSEVYDEVVFLGDWVDTLASPPEVASFYETCVFLRYLMLEHPRHKDFVFILGNHDLQYIHLNCKPSRSSVVPERTYYCSGFTKTKARDWRRAFYDEGLKDNLFWGKFKPAYLSQGIVFSHAGVSPTLLSYGEDIVSFVENSCMEAWLNYRQLTHPKNYILSDVGRCRGGSSRRGGLLWLDWREEFTPSSVVGSQIVGHTTVSEPEKVVCETGLPSWNLDTEKHYAIAEGSELVIKSLN
jgi:hypothetical protein